MRRVGPGRARAHDYALHNLRVRSTFHQTFRLDLFLLWWSQYFEKLTGKRRIHKQNPGGTALAHEVAGGGRGRRWGVRRRLKGEEDPGDLWWCGLQNGAARGAGISQTNVAPGTPQLGWKCLMFGPRFNNQAGWRLGGSKPGFIAASFFPSVTYLIATCPSAKDPLKGRSFISSRSLIVWCIDVFPSLSPADWFI